MGSLWRLRWVLFGLVVCFVVTFSILDWLQSSAPIPNGLLHPSLPVQPQPGGNPPDHHQRKSSLRAREPHLFSEHIAQLWKQHEGRWSDPPDTVNRNVPEACIPPTTIPCDEEINRAVKNYTHYQNIRTIKYDDPSLCVRKDLSNAPENSPPRAVHYFWRAPIFHSPEKTVRAFKNTAYKWETRWSIGGIYPEIPYGNHKPALDLDTATFLIWERYRESAAGRTTSLSPHFSLWSEVEPYLFNIRNAVLGIHGAAADCYRRIYHFFPGPCYTVGDYMKEVCGATAQRANNARWNMFSPKYSIGRPDQVIDRAIVIFQSYGEEYYHFLIECAPRLIYWLPYVKEHDIKVIVPRGGPWIKQLLTWIGIPKDNIVYNSEFSGLVRLLHVPTPNTCLFSQGIYLRAMRDYMISRLDPVPDSKRTILFISRKDASRGRTIINEDDLIAAVKLQLPNETVRVFNPFDIPLPDQFQIFHAAKIVIGPHGAGFGNTIACQKDTKLIEVANEMPRNFFLEFAAKLNFEMHLVLGKVVTGPGQIPGWDKPIPQSTNRDSSVFVDVQQVVDLVKGLVEQGFDHLRTKENEELGSKLFVADDSWYPVCCRNTTWNIGY